MNKEKAIKQINLTKQRVNEGSKAFRDQIDLNVLPIVEDNPGVTELIKKARRTWTGVGREAKDWLNQAITKITSPEPPPWKPSCKKAKFFHFDALGIFLDVLDNAWKSKYEEETFERITGVLRRSRNYGCSAVEPFTWLMDNKPDHTHLKKMTPWEWKDGQVNFKKPNLRYRELYERFCRTVKAADMQLIPQAHMARYCYYPFEAGNNLNGVKNFFHDKANQYTLGHAQYLVDVQAANGMLPGLKALNEFIHGGSDARFHLGANWHKMIWLGVKDSMKMEDFVIDISHSDGCRAQLVYHGPGDHFCPKCKVYKWDNIEAYNRLAQTEGHGVSILDDLEYGHKSFSGFLGSANWQLKYSEDGSSNLDCNIIPIPWSKHWRLGDADQVYEQTKYAWGKCKNARTRKHYYWGIFPMEQFIKTEYGHKSYYDVDTINWDRFEAAQRAHTEVHG